MKDKVALSFKTKKPRTWKSCKGSWFTRDDWARYFGI